MNEWHTTTLPNPLKTVDDLEQLLGQEALPLWFYAGSSKWCAPTAHALGHIRREIEVLLSRKVEVRWRSR